jgi:putative membrane protein
MSTRPSFGSRLEISGLVALVAFTVTALLGYGLFALRPQNLVGVPYAAEFFAISFRFFAQLHIVLCFAALAIVLISRTGLRWLPTLAAVYALSLTSEHLGTGYGIPFGGYSYSTLLGIRVGPRVPALIPLSWFLMALPSWVIARAAFPGSRSARMALAAFGLVLWDLALDPAMSSLTTYWRWEETGPYYGMPWMNLLGWYVTGLALMGAIEFFARGRALDGLPVRWMMTYWGVVLLMPIGMLSAAGSWLGVVTTLVAIGATTAVVTTLRAMGVASGTAREVEGEVGSHHGGREASPVAMTVRA